MFKTQTTLLLEMWYALDRCTKGLSSRMKKTIKNMSKQELDALVARTVKPHCPMCVKDENIFCPRDVDTICIQCDAQFCAGHILQHMKKSHQITPTMEHCTK